MQEIASLRSQWHGYPQGIASLRSQWRFGWSMSLRGHLCPWQSQPRERSSSYCFLMQGIASLRSQWHGSLQGIASLRSQWRFGWSMSLRGHLCPWQSQPRERSSSYCFLMQGIASLRSQWHGSLQGIASLRSQWQASPPRRA